MLVSRIISSIRRIVTSAPDPILLNCQERLEHLLTDKRRMFPHSLMMIDNLPINIDPLTGQRVPPYRSVQEVIEKTKYKFGPNNNLTKALIKMFCNDPAELMKVIDRLEEVFEAMEANGFNPRKIVPALYMWVTDEDVSRIPQHIYLLDSLVDRISEIMKEKVDPAKVLWHDALVAKGYSAGSFAIYP